MNGPVTKYLTVEGLCAALGALWFVVSSLVPSIPPGIPLGFALPVVGDTITPGLLIGLALVPVLIKDIIPGTTPFLNSNTPPKEAP